MSYTDFIARRRQHGANAGFSPTWMPDSLFDFQRHLTEWAINKGRAALYEDCGLGKTLQQLVWAENVVRHTNKPVMIATPIAVGQQTCREADKFGIEAVRVRDGKRPPGARIVVTNYEQLHKYDPADFAGMVCDESSAIKDFKSERKKIVTEFMRTIDYRLLCTATAAPNDFFELGTSSEALGLLGFRDMITTFFKQIENGGRRWSTSGYATKYRFRGHAEEPFWSWVCSWARSLRKPSDLGFDDSRFVLPELIENERVIELVKARPGMLLAIPARDMREERAERRHSLSERCEAAACLATSHDDPCVCWVELNPEGDMLERLIPDCRQISGNTPDDEKEELLIAFSTGQLKRLVTKPKIGAWGLNWQHCNHTVVFPSHSYEQYYQLVRRFYRFGQTRPVTVDIVMCEGERGIMENLKRKQRQAVRMFESIVKHMSDAMHITSSDYFPDCERVPAWLVSTK